MAEPSPFKPADVVVAISGGPVMTVTKCAEDQLGEMTVWCTWIDNNKTMRDAFPAAALKLYEGE